jgi:hypothetical protein
MRVVSMAFIEIYFYFFCIITAVLALASHWFPVLVYVTAVVLLIMLYLQIVSIPLQLNWSRDMYGGLLRRQFFYVIYSCVIYGVHFYFGGIVGPDRRPGSLLDAVYFSFTTWTTLGYGDFAAAPSLRLATSIEALTGVLTIAVLTATVWLYCQERLWPRSVDADAYSDIKLRLDSSLGVWHELESDATRAADARRQAATTLRPCPLCGRSVYLDKYFDITGRMAPFAWFMAVCECGAHSRPRRNAFLAEREWNRRGPIEAKSNHIKLKCWFFMHKLMIFPLARVVKFLLSAGMWFKR